MSAHHVATWTTTPRLGLRLALFAPLALVSLAWAGCAGSDVVDASTSDASNLSSDAADAGASSSNPDSSAANDGSSISNDASSGFDGSPGVDAGSAHDGGAPSDASAASDAGTAPDASSRTTPDECANPGQDWIFCSSFEEGDFSPWDDYDGNPATTNTLPLDPGPFDLASNHVLRLHVPPGRGGADVVKVLDSSHDRLYARWFMKWEDGYDFDAPNHGSGLHAGARNWLGRSDFRPQGNDWFTAWVEPRQGAARLNLYSYYRGMYQDCRDPNGECWGDNFPCMGDEGQTYCTRSEHRETVLPPLMEADRWYCIELMMDGGQPAPIESQATGQLDFWIDGLEIGPWQDLWLRTTADVKVSILWLSLFHHESHSDAGLRFDDVVVSTSRIGCPPR